MTDQSIKLLSHLLKFSEKDVEKAVASFKRIQAEQEAEEVVVIETKNTLRDFSDGISFNDLTNLLCMREKPLCSPRDLGEAINLLLKKGEIYSPKKDFYKLTGRS